MINHVNYLKTLSEHLDAVGDPIKENDLVIILISSLPEEYNHLITTLETIAEERLSWDYVRDRVIYKHDKINNGGVSTTKKEVKIEDALLMERGKYQRNISRSKEGKCFYCQKKGHFAKDCYKKKADQKKDPKTEAANSAEDSNAGSATATSEIALAVNTNASKKNEWWIDSGASKHMTPENAKMLNYTKFSNPLPVKLADNNVLYAYGKGNLRFPVFDGTRKFNLFLEDVLYVPKIKRNLLSLPTMTQRGAEVRFKEDIVPVVHFSRYRLSRHSAPAVHHLSDQEATKPRLQKEI
eukprot:gene12375-3031_t